MITGSWVSECLSWSWSIVERYQPFIQLRKVFFPLWENTLAQTFSRCDTMILRSNFSLWAALRILLFLGVSFPFCPWAGLLQHGVNWLGKPFPSVCPEQMDEPSRFSSSWLRQFWAVSVKHCCHLCMGWPFTRTEFEGLDVHMNGEAERIMDDKGNPK